MNLRLKWPPKPGNDFHLVANPGYDTSLDQFRPTTGDISPKGT